MGKPSGLFGFIGLPPKVRHDNAQALRNAIVKQLVRCFGTDAAEPDTLHVEDWAENPFICTPTDITEQPQHPQLTPSVLRKPFWDDRIFFAVAELATVSPGLIEGAFHIGTTVAKSVSETLLAQQADLER
jgi:monoamine oxidase